MTRHYRPALFIAISLVGFALLIGFVRFLPYSRSAVILAILLLALIFLVTVTVLNLDQTRRRLERRVQELNTLQVIGQSLNAHLDLESILLTIYHEVSRLMPADIFYLAVTPPEEDETSFQLLMEYGQKVQKPTSMSEMAKGLLKMGRPLLISENVNQTLEQLGVGRLEKSVASWLSVPIPLATHLIGVIVVQSVHTPQAYDEHHQEILVTIATQAAIAIENARLYAQADTALARRVQELDSILQTTEDAILLLDRDWRILMANRALTELVGLNGLVGTGQLATAWPHEGQTLIERVGYTLATLGADCHALAHGEKRLKKQMTLPTAPGQHLERMLTAVLDTNQEITGWLLMLYDITEEVELVRMREDMTHMLVHDLRSPLFVLLGGIETAKLWIETGKSTEAPKVLDLSHKTGKQLLSLLNDLLDFYKFEGGNIPLSLKEVPAAYLLTECHIHLSPLAAEAQIEVVVEAEPDLPPALVDENYIGRVLNNLLDNAIKFTPDNGRIRLWAKLDHNSTQTMLIGVSDTGPGISPEAQNRLFQKFQQDITKGGRRKGTGLGLPYCKLVVEAHGGKIWVESNGNPGEGATFVMRLPVKVESTTVRESTQIPNVG